VGAADELDDGERPGDGQRERVDRIAPAAAGESHHAGTEQGHATDRHQPPEQDRTIDVVVGQPDADLGHTGVQRPVGRHDLPPHRVHALEDGRRESEPDWSELARIDPLGGELTVGHVAVHVPAPDRRAEQERQHP